MKQKISEHLNKILNNKKQLTIVIVCLCVLLFLFWISPPTNFQNKAIVQIEDGDTVTGVARKLESQNIIKSKILFSTLIQISRSHVVAGQYLFKEPEGLFTVVRRIARGDYGSRNIPITLFEGMTTKEMAETIKYYIPNFNDTEFLRLTKGKEGYLFPDTYIISDLATPREVLKMIEDNFQLKINSVDALIKNSKYSLEQIIIMASIIERESDAYSKQQVADILWKRFEEDFPLQVDAPFVYAIGRGTFDLTKEDLKSDNPYNTYVNKGLIPTPISNPGLEAIKAAANPGETKYWYFLTGNDGKMYYASTFEQHKKNRLLYLD